MHWNTHDVHKVGHHLDKIGPEHKILRHEVAPVLPLRFWDRTQIDKRGQRHGMAHVGPIIGPHTLVVEVVGARALPVGGTEVIRLLEPLECETPTHGAMQRPCLEHDIRTEVEIGELLVQGRQPGGHVNGVVLGRRDNPDESVMLIGRQLDEPTLSSVDRVKPHRLRHAAQGAIEVVGPPVVRTGEAAGMAT